MKVIDFDQVSKAYQLGVSRTSLREAIADGARSLFKRTDNNGVDTLFWAVRDVSFQVEQGEVLGIIGHNGAGKSTMLKLLSRVTHPTKGSIRTWGRMASLIELGAGFHPDLSGRENVYLNGAILGLKRNEIDAQLDSIVSFAGLEKFIDTPVKRYSSGMYVRLAFAVAAHVKADLLLVDEVLSVGDLNFQERSLDKMKQLRDDGTTIVFISHNIPAVRSFCSRALLMDHGRLITSGIPSDVIGRYERLEEERWHEQQKQKVQVAAVSANGHAEPELELVGGPSIGGAPRMPNVQVLDLDGIPSTTFEFGQGMIVRLPYSVPDQIRQPRFRFLIRREMDDLVCVNRSFSQETQLTLHGRGHVDGRIENTLLCPGEYTLQAFIFEDNGHSVVASSDIVPFVITGWEADSGDGVFKIDVDWTLNQQ